MCVIMTDSRCCMAETDSTVKIKKMIIIFNLLKKKQQLNQTKMKNGRRKVKERPGATNRK